MSCCIGVALLDLSDSHSNDLIARADAALYAAKSAGRDAIVARSAHPAAIDDDSTRPICVRAS